jgi:predicted lipoprotein with Yx(FWY)xxD motif
MNRTFPFTKVPSALRVAGPLAAAAILATACGAHSSGSAAAAPAPTSAAPSSAAGTGTASATTVDVVSSKGKAFLTDSSGRSLYLFGADSKTMSTCSAACATAWPPLTVTGAPMAGTGVTSGDLGTITRSDGTKQVTYAGHPLYYFAGDSAAGQTNGEGSHGFGAPWYVVAPSGQQVTSLSAASAAKAAPAKTAPAKTAPATTAPAKTAAPSPAAGGGSSAGGGWA